MKFNKEKPTITIKRILVNSPIIFASLFFLSLLIYTHYKSSLIYENQLLGKYLKYYLFSIIGLIGSVSLFFFGKKIRTNAGLFIISCIFSLYLFEAGMDAISRISKSIKTNFQYDHRSKGKVLSDFQEQDPLWVPSFSPIVLLSSNKQRALFPLSGISNSSTVFCNESGDYVTYESDRYGFNNKDSIWDSGGGGILLLGDSMTQGACVNPDENIAGNLQSLTSIPVINLGISGNGPVLSLGALKEYGPKISPQYVVWFFFEGNDLISDLPQEKLHPIISQYVHDGFSQNLEAKQQIIDFLWRNKLENNFQKMEKLKRFLKLTNIRGLFLFDVPNSMDLDFFQATLKEGKRFSESLGAKMIFVYLPVFERYTHEKENNLLSQKRKVIEIIDHLGIEKIDADQEFFSKSKDKKSFFPLRLSAHYNEEGYRGVSELIMKHLDLNR